MITTTPAPPGPTTPPAVRTLRFPKGAIDKIEGPWYDRSQLPGASAVTLDLGEVPVGTFLEDVYLDVECTTSGNAAAVAFTADGPWAAIQEVSFLDPTGNPIHGPMTGYDLYLLNLLGGYAFQTDPVTSPRFLATTGAVGAGGSFAFLLRIPIQLIYRDAIGGLKNGAANAAYKVRLVVAPSASIYTVAPTALATIRFRLFSAGWTVPSGDGAPSGFAYARQPAYLDTLQQWSKQVYNLAAGTQTVPLNRKGNWMRELVFIFRDNTGARVNTLVTSGAAMKFFYETFEMWSGTYELARWQLWERNLVLLANIPAGVILFPFNFEFVGKVGSELRDNYLPTQPGTRLDWTFSSTGIGTLTVLTNDVIPSSSNPGAVL